MLVIAAGEGGGRSELDDRSRVALEVLVIDEVGRWSEVMCYCGNMVVC